MSSPNQCHDIFIALLKCVYWLKLVSQVSDGAHGSLVVLHTISGTWVYHHGWRVTFVTSVWPSPLASISKLYFCHEFLYGQDRVCSLTWAYQILHIGVSPWTTCCVHSWPWPLTYMWWLRYLKWVLFMVFILFEIKFSPSSDALCQI